ncbi:hypothetical protein FOL46_008294 [Perkinsus olseni]|uniref:Uncharacterized protein n=1 Tax=Perkinsus olseni TaxID=32597 RepID=A0A7J6MMW8_PEROL|nr:hypothetical protein FOL46_008294 [Perkinsus olseni]
MRVALAASIFEVVVGFGTSVSEDTMPTGDYCEELCTQTAGCDQSYCKDNGLCFGLYHKGESKCYQPGSDATDCDDSVLEPVQCAEYPVTTCEDVCNGIDGCKDSKWGTYCKSWQSPAVCFGIVVKDDGSLCFNPTDEECVGEPYLCEMATVVPSNLPETSVVPTNLPETSVVPTNLPETSVVPTNLPETTVVPTNLPETTVVPTNLPETTVVPTNLPETTSLDGTASTPQATGRSEQNYHQVTPEGDHIQCALGYEGARGEYGGKLQYVARTMCSSKYGYLLGVSVNGGIVARFKSGTQFSILKQQRVVKEAMDEDRVPSLKGHLMGQVPWNIWVDLDMRVVEEGFKVASIFTTLLHYMLVEELRFNITRLRELEERAKRAIPSLTEAFTSEYLAGLCERQLRYYVEYISPKQSDTAKLEVESQERTITQQLVMWLLTGHSNAFPDNLEPINQTYNVLSYNEYKQ